MDKKDNFLKIKHLYSRAGFGISYTELEKLSKKSSSRALENFFPKERKPQDLDTVSTEDSRSQMMMQAALGAKKDLTPEEKEQRKNITRLQNERSRDLNIAWLQRMMTTEDPFLEKMTLFWHGHFACRSNDPYYAQQLNNIQRTNALGDFKTLLVEVSKSPAMLQYLNNQQNRKNHPNENFARELMELFTIGRGNYTEQDIKESARAFTGWTYTKEGAFEFKPAIHDSADKTFFGKTGNFDGEAIIDMILADPKTATFLARKLYAFFVNDMPNDTHIAELATFMYQKQYHIGTVMQKMFSSDWFYAPENIGNKIKSPVEFIVGLSREFYVTYNRPQVLIQLQSSLGQYLFNPPNVAGWPGGRSWIDSSSLMLRMKIPSLVLNGGVIDFSGKADPEDEALIALNKKPKAPVPVRSYVNAQADWDKFLTEFPKTLTPTELAAYLLQPQLNAKFATMVTNSQSLRHAAIEITSMPEYQLC